MPIQLVLPIVEPPAPSPDADPAPGVPDSAMAELHRALGERLGRPVDVVGTDNRRSLASWREGPDGVLEIRLQRQFALGGPDVVDALARFIQTADPAARQRLTEHAETFAVAPPRPVFAPPAGRHHDLRDHLAEQSVRFDSPFRGRIGWSRGARGQARRRIRLGSWSAEHQLIRVHPALDSPDVPSWVVGFVVFHELLHAALGVDDEDGRRRVHTPEFRRLEKAHPDHARSERWIHDQLDHLLTW